MQFIAVPERTSPIIQTFSKFAFDISAGQPAERSQALQFYCETDNVFLFDAQPSISHDGTLSFKLSSNTFGQANVTVHLFEIGGLIIHPFILWIFDCTRGHRKRRQWRVGRRILIWNP